MAGIALTSDESGSLLAMQMAATGALGTAPLDRYSFPSGHTLHAVCFTVLAAGSLSLWPT
jgi:membrane-associated phospholipid phosphatase